MHLSMISKRKRKVDPRVDLTNLKWKRRVCDIEEKRKFYKDDYENYRQPIY